MRGLVRLSEVEAEQKEILNAVRRSWPRKARSCWAARAETMASCKRARHARRHTGLCARCAARLRALRRWPFPPRRRHGGRHEHLPPPSRGRLPALGAGGVRQQRAGRREQRGGSVRRARRRRPPQPTERGAAAARPNAPPAQPPSPALRPLRRIPAPAPEFRCHPTSTCPPPTRSSACMKRCARPVSPKDAKRATPKASTLGTPRATTKARRMPRKRPRA